MVRSGQLLRFAPTIPVIRTDDDNDDDEISLDTTSLTRPIYFRRLKEAFSPKFSEGYTDL